jgi:hypothetical protein
VVRRPRLARDWQLIVDDCDDDGVPDEAGEVTILEEGGWGAIRVGRPGQTDLAGTFDGITLRVGQADQTYLAVSAVPNARPHTELDFGTLVWTAYGSRLLADLSYGTIGGDRYWTEPDYVPDNNPTGHTTLVIPEAEVPGQPSTNSSQIDGEAGSLSLEAIDGFTVLRLDGAAVYGRDDPELGWLEAFDRRLLALADGHFLVIDSFEVRADRPDSEVQEYWYSWHQEEPPEAVDCVFQDQHVELVSDDPSELTLLPVCSHLASVAGESAGRIVADSVEPGGFVLDTPISFLNRLNLTEWRGRSRYVPDTPVRQDLRVFLLLSATSEPDLPEAAIDHTTCAAGVCFTISIGADAWELSFTDASGGYTLLGIDSP